MIKYLRTEEQYSIIGQGVINYSVKKRKHFATSKHVYNEIFETAFSNY